MTIATRADLARYFPAFAALDADTSGNPSVWCNNYTCECGESWSDEWSCQCDDECAKCGSSMNPHDSEWIGPEDLDLMKLWEALPEAVRSASVRITRSALTVLQPSEVIQVSAEGKRVLFCAVHSVTALDVETARTLGAWITQATDAMEGAA
jgi:hypothetical protein